MICLSICQWVVFNLTKRIHQWVCNILLLPCVFTVAPAHVMAMSTPTSALTSAPSLTYATRIDAVAWSFEGSKFACQISHNINDFGTAVFERQAGIPTRFFLQSQNPRMQSGKAALNSQPPAWLADERTQTIALIDVRHGEVPVTIQRKTSERMLAELEKGMDLHVVRKPWYGDKQSLTVVIPSVGFGKTYSDYLSCLGSLLPVNFSQVEKKSLYYNNTDEDLTQKVERYLKKVITYIKEDPAVKVVYIDGHTDSAGIRSDNLLKSKERTQRVVDYLIKNGVPENLIMARWHGERYQVATNQTNAGKAKNRRVTIRLSKEQPSTVMAAPKASAEKEMMNKPKDQQAGR